MTFVRLAWTQIEEICIENVSKHFFYWHIIDNDIGTLLVSICHICIRRIDFFVFYFAKVRKGKGISHT